MHWGCFCFVFLSPRLFCQKKKIPKRGRGRALTAGRDNPPKIEEDSARDGEEVEMEGGGGGGQPTSEVWMCGCIIYKEEDSYFISWAANGLPGASRLSWTDITRRLHFFYVSIEIEAAF